MTSGIKPKKIAVVGGGIFGVTAAAQLAQKGHQVHLFEKNSDILQAASGINQYRLHRGYHYPRSKETIQSALASEESFRKEYGPAIIDDLTHYYCIAKEKSLVDAETYLKTCKKHNLDYEPAEIDVVRKDKLDIAIKAKESLIDPAKLRELCWQKLKNTKVGVFLGIKADKEKLKNYDFVILCAYAALNSLLEHLPQSQKNYQFELCEKPVLKLPKSFANKSIVIMDGPFMCVDPFGRTGLSVMGNVVHAIHQTNVGKHPDIDERFKPFLNRGVVHNPPVTNIKKFIEAATEFMPEMKKAEHIGSMFTVRTVLPDQDDTDARPTLVSRADERTITVFSGKLSNCVQAAEEVVKKVDAEQSH